MAITHEQIVAAAEALVARGESVTNNSVRAELGDTGSFTTISEALKGWRERLQARAQAAQLPPAVQEALAVELADALTGDLDRERAAAEELRRELADLREAHRQTCECEAAAHAESARLETEVERLRMELDEAQRLAPDAERKVVEACAQAGELRETVSLLETERNQARGALQEAQGEVRELARQVEAHSTALKALRARKGAETLQADLAPQRLTPKQILATFHEVQAALALPTKPSATPMEWVQDGNVPSWQRVTRGFVRAWDSSEDETVLDAKHKEWDRKETQFEARVLRAQLVEARRTDERIRAAIPRAQMLVAAVTARSAVQTEMIETLQCQLEELTDKLTEQG